MSLLVLWVGADDSNDACASNDTAVVADALYGCPYLHERDPSLIGFPCFHGCGGMRFYVNVLIAKYKYNSTNGKVQQTDIKKMAGRLCDRFFSVRLAGRRANQRLR